MKINSIYIKKYSNLNYQQGFTLIELLVVVIIVGILAAIATPSLLGNIGKSRESEATINLGTLSRSQQGYHFENQQFADTLNKLSNNVALNTKYYNFPDPGAASNILVKHQAIPLNVGFNQIRNYTSGVYFDNLSGDFDIVICQGQSINAAVDVPATASGSCTNGGKKIK